MSSLLFDLLKVSLPIDWLDYQSDHYRRITPQYRADHMNQIVRIKQYEPVGVARERTTSNNSAIFAEWTVREPPPRSEEYDLTPYISGSNQ
jgi:hypothetical protein